MLLSIREASEKLKVSIWTLRFWERQGKITPYRTPGKHRRYEEEELDELIGRKKSKALKKESIE